MPEPIIIYGFKNRADEFVDVSFDETQEAEARLYANENGLLLVQSVYEWQEDIEVEDHRLPPNSLLRAIPPVGSRVRLGELDRFPDFRFDAGETGTVSLIDFEHGIATVKLDLYHSELDEWDNDVQLTTNAFTDYPDITDKGDRLRMAFWTDVAEVLPEDQQYPVWTEKNLPQSIASVNIKTVFDLKNAYEAIKHNTHLRFGQYIVTEFIRRWGGFNCSELFHTTDNVRAFQLGCMVAEHFNPMADKMPDD